MIVTDAEKFELGDIAVVQELDGKKYWIGKTLAEMKADLGLLKGELIAYLEHIPEDEIIFSTYKDSYGVISIAEENNGGIIRIKILLSKSNYSATDFFITSPMLGYDSINWTRIDAAVSSDANNMIIYLQAYDVSGSNVSLPGGSFRLDIKSVSNTDKVDF